jgi:hypothetical protein
MPLIHHLWRNLNSAAHEAVAVDLNVLMPLCGFGNYSDGFHRAAQ